MSTTELPKVSEIMFKYLEMSTPSVQIKQDLQEIFISMKQQINILDMALKSPQNQDFFTLFNLGFSHISKLLMYCYIITKYLNQSSIPIIKEKIVNSRPYIKKYCFYSDFCILSLVSRLTYAFHPAWKLSEKTSQKGFSALTSTTYLVGLIFLKVISGSFAFVS